MNLYQVGLLILIFINRALSLPVTRMRVCVQSSDPSRLQSQCVYCNNRSFVPTVRHCTGNTYLPASMSVEEAFCLVRLCRRQMPAMRPEPFYPINIQSPVDPINTAINSPNDVDYTDSEALYSESQSSAPTVNKRRPPASFSVGKPQRPVRPFLFGKRSIDSIYAKHSDKKHLNIPTNSS